MKNAKGIVENYTVGSIDMSGCDLKGITLPTSVGGDLDLIGCDLKGIALPTSVGGWLDLSGCDLKGITLPTSVGGDICMVGCDNVPNGVYNCGNEGRTIAAYNHPEKGLVISLGCFVGTEVEAIQAIKEKYGDTKDCEEYIEKVSEAFKLYRESLKN